VFKVICGESANVQENDCDTCRKLNVLPKLIEKLHIPTYIIKAVKKKLKKIRNST